MKIAVMQPYLFPYIGYFQLMHAVDKFIILDDVSYIQQGWINRNRLLINHRDYIFTVPLKKPSYNKLIKDLEISGSVNWHEKLLKTIAMAYKKSPYFKSVFPVIEAIIRNPDRVLVNYIAHSLIQLNNFLGIETELVKTTQQYQNQYMKGEERILDICQQENCNFYINAIGGTALYSTSRFSEAGIKLRFLKSHMFHYRQFGKEFIPWLSLIDVLMFNGARKTAVYMENYELITGETL